ncbi:1-acyl-sn-glycerol-3-phosphate acyltransferase [Priestia megaterium]|uniref:1-acyl-sn-glycerol-3-phosphate acyltransferase n=1 Tax=Priestia megaterium (strain ATCC 14581 / DSM 32 / CCUG 1817 / JCM 2506 / NBRC 15308 / NCIMB 9376 / NCTC 10342 / NRRL B-14308 / VKM B-512 / Ford 19) TaxID=1348623 RepID=A0A0B6AYQ1_PRIM2|nr:lysophospholipid acyltransferase family protein [Priestia megaterium]AJI25044.1 1-acylglycerol-3-phosphate O-acyltransferases domain protein [Priestia megaterium NBRC 15308 = ATCC 14581]KFM97999.1 1-acylglycerol-3-phosphate O-acyltransferases domain protein [Priestia megaterium]KGJ84892.1 acyl-phosphate glycerol 3-phosphate acyltransferase [Priestia megaterium NBRC 15308 = ATCC 14581]MDQ0805083.1 1-acyl-sn-glycerol-3-phosphate acyltransferase [Priestia megaterium]MDR4234931.1 1-acyl-sn-glyc
MYNVAAHTCKFLLKRRGKLHVRNREYLPMDTGFVIACSHKGWIDVVALGAAVLPHQIHFMAKKELFNHILTSNVLKKLNAFPVDRNNPGPSSIKIPIKLAKEGHIVGIFPSGTRTEEDVPLKKGAVTIASMAKVPIVPAVYKGPTNVKELFSKGPLVISFGKPIYLGEDKLTKDRLADVSNHLTSSIRALEETAR